MSTRVIEQPAQVRCYHCGKPEVVGVCHHCGRPMCRNHMRQATKGATGTITLEFTDLGLGASPCGELPVHCIEHDHIVLKPSLRSFVNGLLIALLGVLVTALQVSQEIGNPLIGMAVFLIGGLVAATGMMRHQQQRAAYARLRPDLPVLPYFDEHHKPMVRETMSAMIALDRAGDYSVKTAPTAGSLNVSASFAKPERERLEKYLKKYKLAVASNLQFQAGFALLRGSTDLAFIENDSSASDGGVIRLTGSVETQPILNGTGGRGAAEWGLSRNYRLLESSKLAGPQRFPLRLAPSLAPESARRTLDLELMWFNAAQDGNPLEVHRIEQLELRVPATWGHAHPDVPGAKFGIGTTNAANGSALRTITWLQVAPSSEERTQRRKSFAIQFENDIDAADRIEGHVEVSFRGALSQLKGVDLYYPLGIPFGKNTTDIETKAIADFKLDLSSLRYQDTRVVPDSKRENDADRQNTLIFAGVIPDHVTVMALTNAISNANFYVKRVIENPPRTGERANLVNRYWDIAGRRYLGVYPIDFHLVISGEEVYSGEIRVQAGTTKATLTVQGVYSNPEMEGQIEGVWDQLTALIGETLKPLVRAAPAPPVLPTDFGAAAALLDRTAKLSQRKDQLFDALMEGRITEAMYEKLRAQIEQEMQALP